MKRLILTFDYELLFGDRSGSVEKSLVEPTRKILAALRAVGGKAVFFVDCLMLKRMYEECDETRQQAAIIEEQLREIVRQGSRIELHLHTHWVDAKYRGKDDWDFSDFTHYCLDSLPQEVVTKMFIDGTDYLNRIASEASPGYRVTAFRAGGWAILPFSKSREGFEKSGIRVDSSVCKGRVIKGYTYSLDFTQSPDQNVYRFSSDVLRRDDQGSFTEVQISSFRFNPVTYILNSLYRKRHLDNIRCQTDGTHLLSKYENAQKAQTGSQQKKLSLWKRFWIESGFAINETYKWAFFYHVFFSSRKYTVIMGHPKDFNEMTTENIRFLGHLFKYADYEDVLEVAE